LLAIVCGNFNTDASGSIKLIIGPSTSVVNMVVKRGATLRVWRHS
jgi:hypothetical protein